MTKDNILKKYEDDNEYHLHKVDREWILQAMQEYADQQLRLNIVVSSLPSKKEILKQARKEENYIGNESDIIGAEKTGRFHGFLKGVEWLSNRLKYYGNDFIGDVVGQSRHLKCECTKAEKYYDPIGDIERCQECEKTL